MKQCKTFSLIYTEEAISYLRTLNPEMTGGLGYVDTRPYIRISLGTRITYGGTVPRPAHELKEYLLVREASRDAGLEFLKS